HWDGGWIDAQTSLQAGVEAKMTNFWTQIANNFKSYDNHVLFAGMNEIQDSTNANNPPTASECAVEKSYNQTFVNAVRATGGNNATRPLVVQAYQTNLDVAVSCNATLPTDSAANALIMEIHYYTPGDFTINTGAPWNTATTSVCEWGKEAETLTDTEGGNNSNSESYVDSEFAKMQTTFIDKGVPVIMGEYAAGIRSECTNADYLANVRYWDQYITQSAVAHGVVPIYWDTGSLFDRNTGAQLDPTTIGMIVKAAQ